MLALELAFWIISLICIVIIAIDAFEDEIWKGILCLLFWPYTVYYAFAEFEHEMKVWILVGLLVGGLGQIGMFTLI